ncbi:MAG: class I SAM-dependent methyltransferase [Thermoplasmata archaeon]|nr:MAG: class I SAM-dependent methyltransferase [Thermoplasmata archaeon]
MYRSASLVWEDHVLSFDEAVKENGHSFDIFMDGGCGREKFLERYSNQFRFCIGIDTDLRECNKSHNNIQYIKGDLEGIPLKDASVDVILTNFVLEHIRRPKRFFMEASRVMKKEGILIIWTPNAKSPAGLMIHLLPISFIKNFKKNFIGHESYPTYYLSNSPLKLDAMLKESGLQKAKLEMKDGVFYFSEFKVVRLLHSVLIKLTDCDGFGQFKDLIFAVYLKAR